MSIGHALFFSFISTFVAVLVISFWADKIAGGQSGKGLLITALIAFIAILLFLLYAPKAIITTALLIALGIVVFTLIVFWISGN